MEKEPATTAFHVTCPACGQRLRFALAADAPGRLRIRCSSCEAQFAVRRPGLGPQSPRPGNDAPTYVGAPVAPSVAAGLAQTGPLPGRTAAPGAAPPPWPRPIETAAFSPGEVVAGRYRVSRFIARGGMGEVYEVEDLELHGRVALKTVRPEVARDAATVERFKREIQLARKVTHPNVCRIFDLARHQAPLDAGAGGSVVFLTMELLAGETLGERLRRGGPLTPGEALPVLRQIAAGLDAAHLAGVVHRDLKPGNVVLVPAVTPGAPPRAVVTDFGLARAREREDQGLSLTTAGVVGTPAYIAPEQVTAGEITGAVDIYALGVVLYEMLTGKVPFLGDTALSTAVKRLQEAPLSPRLHAPELDARWEAAILRCLERDPADRFATAREVVAAVEAEPVAERPRHLGTATQEIPAAASGGRRRRAAAAALGLLILLSFSVAGYRVYAWREARRETRQRLHLPEGPIVPRRSIAVLGFKDRSGRPDTAWLSAALAEMLSTELGAGKDLRVVAGENVARMKVELNLGESDSLARETLARIRTLLGTDFVVLGSYVVLDGKAGRQIRLDLRLQDAAAGETSSAVAVSGTETELFDLVARAGARLRSDLGGGTAAPDSGALRAALPASPEAARLYAEGLTRLRLFDPSAARGLLARAVAAEPGNALAHSALATAWSALGYDEKGRDEAKAALDLSRGLPQEERLLIEGHYREATADWPRAAEIYRSLWGLFPDSLDYGLRLAAVEISGGRAEEALATVAGLRTLPAPAPDDPRIDLAESTAAGALSDFSRQRAAAARAAAKGNAQGARLLVAQANVAECRALRNLGRAEQALAACEEGRRLHAAAGDRAGVAEALTHAGNVLYDRGDLPGARRRYEEALGTYRELGDKGAEAGALNNIAVVLKSQGQLDSAVELYGQVLSLCREIGSKGGQAYAENNIGAVLLKRGDLAAARKMFEDSLAIRRDLKDRSGEAYALDNIGGALRRQGDLAGALARHEESLAIRRQTGQKIGEVASLNDLGNALLDRGELGPARERFSTALAVARQIGSQSSIAYALFGLGETLAREGGLEEAGRQHQEALAIRNRLGEKGTAAESRLALAALALEEGDAAKADGLAAEAAQELERQGAADGQGVALATAAQAAAARGDAVRARQLVDRAAALLAHTQDLRARLTVGLRTALLHTPADPGQAEAAIRAVFDEATRTGLLDLRLEAGLALAAAEKARGRAADGNALLAAIGKEAREKGYGRIAARAAP